MEFRNRIKKEMTEGIVRAILDDAGYRVIGSGIENVVRELACLSALEYAGLDFPKAMRTLPDLTVMDREQRCKYLVEIKYRGGWSSQLLREIEAQARLYQEIVLVYLNGNPVLNGNIEPSASSYLRCCRLRINPETEVYEAELNHYNELCWLPVDDIGDHAGQWWSLQLMQRVFPLLEQRKEDNTLVSAINALRGILGPA
ncbi:MAG: hypothetical protein J0I01_04590 [Stenotrophomonas nitritireducens]|uniref:hypothetical protein n=1 Tax=Stenotrophomonas nitritireducens TaxID=83617 RepID=UPI001AC97DD1|nr:hypothetical protein [Stenotrophomonas nitritireducens]MBN8791489.1 hypothetical protein [Stenotrophomonas nitritireducens]MBN8795428.1 hypothetical protein [Stenotrophomonas nitritireducens]